MTRLLAALAWAALLLLALLAIHAVGGLDNPELERRLPPVLPVGVHGIELNVNQ